MAITIGTDGYCQVDDDVTGETGNAVGDKIDYSLPGGVNVYVS